MRTPNAIEIARNAYAFYPYAITLLLNNPTFLLGILKLNKPLFVHQTPLRVLMEGVSLSFTSLELRRKRT